MITQIASLIKITRWLDADRCHALNQGECNFPQLVYSPLTHMAISAPNNFHIIWKLPERDKISQKLRKKNIYLDVESDPMGNFGLSMKD